MKDKSTLTHEQLSIEICSKCIINFKNRTLQDPMRVLKRFTQAYLACVTAVDDNIGQVVNAIDNSKFKDNTIIVFVSDHGWSTGRKRPCLQKLPMGRKHKGSFDN
ncbi:MAG: sulfatase-like hydrolase/transferase [Flavobacteriaceae bacterium]